MAAYVLLGGRRGGAVALEIVDGLSVGAGHWAGTERHVVDAMAESPHLQFAQLLLEELEIPPPFAHLGVELGADLLIVCLLAHGLRSIDQSLFALDLLGDVVDLVFVVHGGGIGPGGPMVTVGDGSLGEDEL